MTSERIGHLANSQLTSKTENPRNAFAMRWEDFEKKALSSNDNEEMSGRVWATEQVVMALRAALNETEVDDRGIAGHYYGAVDQIKKKPIIVPIQVSIGDRHLSIARTEFDRLIASQTSLQNEGLHAPMAIMVTLYPVSGALQSYAVQHGQVSLATSSEGYKRYPKLQILSLQEMVRERKVPVLPPRLEDSFVASEATKVINRISLRTIAMEWEEFEQKARQESAQDGIPGWAWAEEQVARILKAVPNESKTGDGGIDVRYYGGKDIVKGMPIVIPVQVKMHGRASSVGRPELQQLQGVQYSLQNQGQHAPMALMVTLYPVSDRLRNYAQQQGEVSLTTVARAQKNYPRLQIISVQEMLQEGKRPVLPPRA